MGDKDALPVMHVLVVDDDDGMRNVLCRLLRSTGFEVDGCGNPIEALGRVQNGRVDVLVTDFVMPELSGLALVEAAKRHRPETRCVIVSGQTRSPETPADVIWVSKPLDIDELLAVLEDPRASGDDERLTESSRA